MKWTLAVALLLTVGAGTGMATAIDFTTLGLTTPSIGAAATGGLGSTLSGVTFLWDDLGDPGSNGTAQLTSHGVDGFGGTAAFQQGILDIIFNTTVTGGLLFDFSLGTASGPLQAADGAFVVLDNLAGDSNTFSTNASGAGTVSFPSTTGGFDQATVFFTSNQSATNFNISDLQYDIVTAPGGVPEPGTYALLASGLLLLGFGRRKLLKRRS